MEIHRLTVADAFASLKSGLAGLSEAEAQRRLVEAFGVRVNNATVTGESLPASRDAEPCEEPEPMHARNTLLAGTSLVSGEAKALVFATGSHSAFGKIAQLTQATADSISPLQCEIVRVSRIVAGLALALGMIFFFVGLMQAAAAMSAYWFVLRSGGWHFG